MSSRSDLTSDTMTDSSTDLHESLHTRLIGTDKPAGLTTHTSLNPNERHKPLADLADGFKEHLEARFDQELTVVHRLDRETTGALLLSRDRETASLLKELFESRAVSKTYLFLTDRSLSTSKLEVESFIERQGNEYVSIPSSKERSANARTVLEKVEESHGLTLWRAFPETGKSHQIRLHAADKGIAILGDAAHGGSPFPALCLHSARIELKLQDQIFKHESPPPIWFERRELAQDRLLIRWLAAIDRRLRLQISYSALAAKTSMQAEVSSQMSASTLRWIHSEGDPLRIEQLGEVSWFSWYRDSDPNEQEWKAIKTLAAEMNWSQWYLQVRGDRGRAPNEERVHFSATPPPLRWSAEENGLAYEFRRDSGLSPGLFLDQRRNRKWVQTQSQGKTVLNLFCYTGGFSVAAGKGGATKTVSVDVSRNFLEWAKRNFELNSLSIEPAAAEFRSMDCREYLAWAEKKGLQYDLVICDPPSFGRSSAGTFRIEKDFESLLRQLLAVLAPGGQLLFSCNYETWDLDEFAQRALKVLKGTRATISTSLSPDLDFELPRQPRNMKSFVVRRVP